MSATLRKKLETGTVIFHLTEGGPAPADEGGKWWSMIQPSAVATREIDSHLLPAGWNVEWLGGGYPPLGQNLHPANTLMSLHQTEQQATGHYPRFSVDTSGHQSGLRNGNSPLGTHRTGRILEHVLIIGKMGLFGCLEAP